jgi:predicted dehydrogenase
MYFISIWSLSNHFQRKVLPSIKLNKKIKIVSILTNKNKKDLKFKHINLYNDKKKNFLNENFNYVYISSANSEHYENCKYALENKKNVICEKPICLKKNQLNNLKKIADKNKKKFQEVIQYTHHPLFIKLKKIINDKIIGNIIHVDSSFKVPIDDKKNFRFEKKLGGGALYDVGFYPISIMFTLFDSKKIKILNSNIIKQNNLDIAGNIKTQNEKKIIFNLSWSFKSSYKNNIKIYGENGFIDVDFIFSKKIFQKGEINIFKNLKKTIKVKESNQINLAFQSMLSTNKQKFNKNFETSMKILRVIENLKKK